MMKTNHAARLGALALALTLVSTCLMGGTLAKYVTEVTGTATAMVAKWSFDAKNGEKSISTENYEVNLTNTKYQETDILDGVIAPGTEGSFKIVVDATGSDVGVDYTINIEKASSMVKDLPKHLVFSTKPINASNTGQSLADLGTGDPLSGTINYNDAKKDKEVTVYWKWPYEIGEDDQKKATNNAQDTTDSTIGEITLNITVTGTQVKPEETPPAP